MNERIACSRIPPLADAAGTLKKIRFPHPLALLVGA